MFVPQLLEKPQQNLEFPKYHIVNTPPVQDTLENKGRKYLRVCVCAGMTPPVSISSGIPMQFSRANFENI